GEKSSAGATSGAECAASCLPTDPLDRPICRSPTCALETLDRSPLLSDSSERAAALHGVRVLDLGRVLAAPLCTMILGDLGAEVIKVERPRLGDDTRQWGPPWIEGDQGRESAYYLCANRNKRSIAVDLKSDAGRERVRALARDADVLVENFLPGTLEGWGLGYETLAAENPRLVHC